MASVDFRPLVVVGSVNADLVLPIARLPKPGETLPADNMDTVPGGKGANQAAAAARLGYPTYFIGQVGTDANADAMKSSLTDSGVNISEVSTVEGATGTALILLQPSGENSIIIVGGANTAAWSISTSAKQVIASSGMVLLQREIPESVNIEVAKLASAAGVPVVLDAGGADTPASAELLKYVTVISPNETELARLSSMPTDTMDRVRAAAATLMAQGPPQVLVKLGANGSLLLRGGEADVRQEAVKVPPAKVVDTTAAGDCYTAAYAVACLEGKPPEEAMGFASRAAAVCVQRMGAQTSLPLRAEVA